MATDRPPSVPKEGEIAPFDAGWHAHEVGLDRDTVRVLAADPGWALLGYDAREKVTASGSERKPKYQGQAVGWE
jgi:hypothetical protein